MMGSFPKWQRKESRCGAIPRRDSFAYLSVLRFHFLRKFSSIRRLRTSFHSIENSLFEREINGESRNKVQKTADDDPHKLW